MAATCERCGNPLPVDAANNVMECAACPSSLTDKELADIKKFVARGFDQGLLDEVGDELCMQQANYVPGLLATIDALRAEVADLERKGGELCCAYGIALMRLAELGEKVVSPNCPHEAEVKRLRDALETAAIRFELIACGNSAASPAVGAREAREALKEKK